MDVTIYHRKNTWGTLNVHHIIHVFHIYSERYKEEAEIYKTVNFTGDLWGEGLFRLLKRPQVQLFAL